MSFLAIKVIHRDYKKSGDAVKQKRRRREANAVFYCILDYTDIYLLISSVYFIAFIVLILY